MKKIVLLVCLISINCFALIPKENSQTFSAQMNRAKNTALPMSQRWDALIQASELAEGDQIKEVLAFSKNKDWYMRNALLVALDKAGNDLVYDKAKDLVSDKALVVRSAAVEVLNRLESAEVRKILLDEVSKNYNFVNGKSLWIRSQIMKSMVKNPNQNEMTTYAKLVFDKDTEIAELSSQALERLSKVRFDGKDKLKSWQNYIKQNKLL